MVKNQHSLNYSRGASDSAEESPCSDSGSSSCEDSSEQDTRLSPSQVLMETVEVLKTLGSNIKGSSRYFLKRMLSKEAQELITRLEVQNEEDKKQKEQIKRRNEIRNNAISKLSNEELKALGVNCKLPRRK